MSAQTPISDSTGVRLKEQAVGGLAGFGQGLFAAWEGLVYMGRHPSLWRYGVLPFLFNVLITAVVLLGCISGIIALMVYLHPYFSSGWLGVSLEILTGLALIVFTIASAFVIWWVLQGVLCGYFYGQLAQAVEVQMGMRPEEMKEISWSQQFLDSCRAACALLGINLGLLALNFIPLVGSLAAIVLGLYFDCWILGSEFFKFPQELRGRRRKEMQAFNRVHRAQTLGLGVVILLVGLIPLVNSVLLTTAVVGVVLLHRRLQPVTSEPEKEWEPGARKAYESSSDRKTDG